jgi:hypothetical protein
MNRALKPEMKLGAEPKKVVLLAGLLVLAAVVYFMNSSSSPGSPATPAAERVARPAGAPGLNTPVRTESGAAARRAPRGRLSTEQFRPTLKPKEPIDPSQIDPTLRLDMLAKLKSVQPAASSRSLFDFAAAPAVAKIEKVDPVHPGPLKSENIIGPVQPKPKPKAPEPPPPPIPLKFYGYSNPAQQGPKRAFFLEGEDIFVAAEGDVIQNRYKVVRIGVNSAVVEDTSNKHQQTLPLEQEQA